jgi:hypothetical protein
LSDVGGEFRNSRVEEMLKAIGATQSFSCVYTPEQNGISERSNRILLDLARSSLIDAELPKYLWAECINTCCKILNMITICEGTNKSAYETMLNQKPYLSKLHPFGSKCFIHVPKRGRKKLDPRGRPATLIGYCDRGRGYRVFLPDTAEIKDTKDVVFPKQSVFNKNTDTVKENKQPDTGDDEQIEGESKETEQPSVTEPEEERAPSPRRLRDRSTLKKPDRYGYEAGLTQTNRKRKNAIVEPSNYQEAMSTPERENWLEAMKSEMDSIKKHEVWDLVKLPPKAKPIACRWVYKVKTDENGALNKFRARLVVKGFAQREGIDYKELFSPTARFDTIRTMLSIAAEEKYSVIQFDISSAYLNAELNETVYVEQAPGFDDGSGRVCLLKKALYGLRQSPRAFHLKFKSILLKLNLIQSKCDQCVFYRHQPERVILCIYVDDAILMSNSKLAIDQTLAGISKELEITHQPLKYFLGIQIKVDPQRGIYMYQQKYIHQLLERFGMSDTKGVTTPIQGHVIPHESESKNSSEYPYRELIGSLMYAAICTRYDIAFAVGYLSRFLGNYTKSHWTAALRVLKYLKTTDSLGLHFGGPNNKGFQAFSDSDFAGDPETRRSTSGEIIKRAGGAIIWSSSRQGHATLSSCEAELVAACSATKSLLWVKRFLEELGYDIKPILKIDNLSTIALIRNSQFHKRTKHISVKFQFTKENVEEGNLDIEYVPTQENEADILTKSLNKVIFQRLRDLAGLEPCIE